MVEHYPSNPRDVIHPHRLKTVGYLLASRPPCTAIVSSEVRNVKRTLRALRPGELPPNDRPRSWVLAVLVCPGDGIEAVAGWVRILRAPDRERVYVFLHPEADRIAALKSGYEAGLDDPITSLAHDLTSFHKSFGARMNLQTYLDFK